MSPGLTQLSRKLARKQDGARDTIPVALQVQLLPKKSQPQSRLHLHPEMEPIPWFKFAHMGTAGRVCGRNRGHDGTGTTALEQCPCFAPRPPGALYYFPLAWLSEFVPLKGFSSVSSKSRGTDPTPCL